MDPKAVIGNYTGCRLNPCKSGLESLELGYIWKYITVTDDKLNGAHDSMVDVFAQTDIVTHQHFIPYLDVSRSTWEWHSSIMHSHEWEDIKGPRPNWIRQHAFIPCDCNNCFFCPKGLTTGIEHKKPEVTKMVFIQHDNSHTVVTKGCTDKQVDLTRGGSYCRMCFRKSKGAVGADGKKVSAALRKKQPYS
jgi:hypothetical protein